VLYFMLDKSQVKGRGGNISGSEDVLPGGTPGPIKRRRARKDSKKINLTRNTCF